MADMTDNDATNQGDRPDLKAQYDPESGYIRNIDDIRNQEYPSLADTVYLDHAGTTLYPKSLIEAFSADLTSNLFGNPHSASTSSQLSARRIDDTRLEALRFFGADPKHFDVIFTANATAATKLVADAFQNIKPGFWYGYHAESHTSLVGVRELASRGSECFSSDEQVDEWLDKHINAGFDTNTPLRLLAYPGQSNMTGQRWSLDWVRLINLQKRCDMKHTYTLYDAAALASTSLVDLSNLADAPDFTIVSFYKIFGFPDLGALIVRKDSGDLLRQRCYFGGGTVDAVSVNADQWHMKKNSSLHASLEDGTLPFHSVIALQHAMRLHGRLYGSMKSVSEHTHFLKTELGRSLLRLRHSNGRTVCEVYGPDVSSDQYQSSGPVISFNLLDHSGRYVSANEVEKLATINGIQLRTGGLCNPGGTSKHLQISSEDLHRNYAAGYRCGGEVDIVNGKPTGTIRVSLGAMSSMTDVTRFVGFITEFFVHQDESTVEDTIEIERNEERPGFYVESLSIFPIKSCAAYNIPANVAWKVGRTGLAWDRYWCLVHQGSHAALSQKKYPRMALLNPAIDLARGKLVITHNVSGSRIQTLALDLEHDRPYSCTASDICGETVHIEHYTDPKISSFFTDALGVPCTLARLPSSNSERHAPTRCPTGAIPNEKPITSLSNESPILLVSRSSVNRLNEHIKQRGGVGKAVSADSFRGNIVVAEDALGGQLESPYAEEQWKQIRIGSERDATFEILGPCQRCQMVCVNQKDASRRREPFSTLAKTRKRDGKVWFGMHMGLKGDHNCRETSTLIRIGDKVQICKITSS